MLANHLQMLLEIVQVMLPSWFIASIVFFFPLGTFFLAYLPLEAWDPLELLLFTMLKIYICCMLCCNSILIAYLNPDQLINTQLTPLTSNRRLKKEQATRAN